MSPSNLTALLELARTSGGTVRNTLDALAIRLGSGGDWILAVGQ